MKYLKLYEEMINIMTAEESFSPLINWSMIEDLKDMSLEYLDYGMKLKIQIIYNPKLIPSREISSIVKYIRISEINFTHNDYNCKWANMAMLMYELKMLSMGDTINFINRSVTKDNISYTVDLIVGNIIQEESIELVSRIKEAYPNEDINHKYNILSRFIK